MEEPAKQLRKSQTPVEQQLWLALNEHCFCQYKFRRQALLGPYTRSTLELGARFRHCERSEAIQSC